MSTSHEALKRHFAKIGAQLEWVELRPRLGRRYDVDVRETRRQGQEVFTVAADKSVEFLAVDVDATNRHLLLMVKQARAFRSTDQLG